MKSIYPLVRKWAKEHPIGAGFVLVILFIIFRKSLYLIFSQLPNTRGLWHLHQILDVIWPFWLVILFGQLSAYRMGRFAETLLAGLPILLLSIFVLMNNMASIWNEPGLEWYPFSMIVFGILSMLAVGFREESVFRGICLNLIAGKYLKDRRGVLFTAWVSAAFFGLIHMGNMISGQSFIVSLMQSANAFFLGAVFAAVYLRGGNLWAMMLLHGFYDYAVNAPGYLTKTYGTVMQILIPNQPFTLDAGRMISYVILFSVYTLMTTYILRKEKCDEIIERYRRQDAR